MKGLPAAASMIRWNSRCCSAARTASPASDAALPASMQGGMRRMSSSVRRSAASSAAQPLIAARSSWIWRMSSPSTRHAYAPLRGTTSTRPVASSERIASRTGLRETPSSAASLSSTSRSPGAIAPLMIIARISSATTSRSGRWARRLSVSIDSSSCGHGDASMCAERPSVLEHTVPHALAGDRHRAPPACTDSCGALSQKRHDARPLRPALRPPTMSTVYYIHRPTRVISARKVLRERNMTAVRDVGHGNGGRVRIASTSAVVTAGGRNRR